MSLMLTDVANTTFFNALANAFPVPTPGENSIKQFIGAEVENLALHVQLNYPNLKLLSTITEDMTESTLANYVYGRFGISLQKIYLALYTQYDALANTSVTETEAATGQDTVSKTGTDTSTVTNSTSTHYATTFDNPSLERETGKTETDSTGTVDYGSTNTLGYGKTVTKTKNGNIGVMPTQDLVRLEYETRMRYRIFDAIITCVCICLSSGVWECDE